MLASESSLKFCAVVTDLPQCNDEETEEDGNKRKVRLLTLRK